jgi:nitrogen regulatory protein PII
MSRIVNGRPTVLGVITGAVAGLVAITPAAGFVAPTIEAITGGARTGQVGDGKIFVMNLEECIRIRTGETGGIAIG